MECSERAPVRAFPLTLAQLGMLLLVLQGFSGTVQVVVGRLCKEREWPFYRFMTVGLVGTSLFIVAGFLCFKVALPDIRAQKWLVARGLFGAASFLCGSLSVRMGTPAGDMAALSSINTLVAALVGRLMLNERLQWIQVMAAFSCICGAVLISKPKFIFGGAGSDMEAWHGYSLALLAGCSQAGISICSRLVKHISPWWPTFAATNVCAIMFAVLPALDVLDDFTLLPFVIQPFESAAWCSLLFIIGTCSMASNSAAGQWCPPAVSATVGTAARIFWGYCAEVVLFGTIPEFLTVCGALLMLASVVAMVFAKSPPPASRETLVVNPKEDVASFVASSFNVAPT